MRHFLFALATVLLATAASADTKLVYAGKIAFGTDMGVGVHGPNATEFVLMVGAGMPPAEALKAAPVNAADLLQLSSTVGTIEAGKAADIIAVPQDPTRDIKVMERVSFVMRGGAIYVGQ